VRYAILLCLAEAGLSLASCGGTSSPGAGGSTSPQDTAANNSKALQFAQCMRAHGVPNFPDPQFQTGPNGSVGVRISGAGVNPNSPAFHAAAKDCGSIFGGAPVTAKAPG
jgi:hypothetical protein